MTQSFDTSENSVLRRKNKIVAHRLRAPATNLVFAANQQQTRLIDCAGTGGAQTKRVSCIGSYNMSSWVEIQREEEDIARLNAIIRQWRMPGFLKVHPENVIPDTSNRLNTGLSAVHAHWIATQISLTGFKTRDNEKGTGHDIPVLVAETNQSELGLESLDKWRKTSESSPEFPQIQFASASPFYTSLGSGHFFQALNLIGTEQKCMFWGGEGIETSAGAYISDNQIGDEQVPAQYGFGADAPLREALQGGVDSIILKPGISREDRKFVSLLHNNLFEYPWRIAANGEIIVDRTQPKTASTWEFVSKKSDAWELEELLKLRLRLQARRRAVKKEEVEKKAAAKARLLKAEEEKRRIRLKRKAGARSRL
jgi:hypothetical protein